jgi:hypothetical protein
MSAKPAAVASWLSCFLQAACQRLKAWCKVCPTPKKALSSLTRPGADQRQGSPSGLHQVSRPDLHQLREFPQLPPLRPQRRPAGRLKPTPGERDKRPSEHCRSGALPRLVCAYVLDNSQNLGNGCY